MQCQDSLMNDQTNVKQVIEQDIPLTTQLMPNLCPGKAATCSPD